MVSQKKYRIATNFVTEKLETVTPSFNSRTTTKETSRLVKWNPQTATTGKDSESGPRLLQ